MEMVLKRQRELRKNGKKGFTLVELIVVIVILAILAAIAVPALTGYIDKARDSAKSTQASAVQTSLQMMGTQVYGDTSATSAPTRTAAFTAFATGDATLADIGYKTTFTDLVTPDVKGEIARMTSIKPANLQAITAITWDATNGSLLSFTYGGVVYSNS